MKEGQRAERGRGKDAGREESRGTDDLQGGEEWRRGTDRGPSRRRGVEGNRQRIFKEESRGERDQ